MFQKLYDNCTVVVNQLNAVMNGWGFPIGSRQRLHKKSRRVQMRASIWDKKYFLPVNFG